MLISPFNNNNQFLDTQVAVNRIVKGMDLLFLQPNPSKCQFMLCSESTTPFEPPASLVISEANIPRGDTMKYLGSTIDGKMPWTKNAELAKSAGKRAIGQVTRLIKR